MKPFVLFENFFELGTFTVEAGGEATGGEKERAIDWRMHAQARWIAADGSVDSELRTDLGAGNDLAAGAVALAGHNLGTLGASAKVEYSSDGVGWTDVGISGAPTDDYPIMVAIDAAPAARYWRILIGGAPFAAPPEIGILTLGRRLDFQGGANLSLEPYSWSMQAEGFANMNGSPLGVNVTHREYRFSIDYGSGRDPGFTVADFWKGTGGLNVDDDFAPHVDGRSDGNANPFWYAWNLDEDPRSWVCRVPGGWSAPWVGTLKRRGWQAEFVGRREVS